MEALEILYLTLAVCIGLLTIFLSFTLIYLMFILRDISKIADKVKDISEKVDTYITKPILMTKGIIEFITPFIQSAESVVKKKKK